MPDPETRRVFRALVPRGPARCRGLLAALLSVAAAALTPAACSFALPFDEVSDAGGEGAAAGGTAGPCADASCPATEPVAAGRDWSCALASGVGAEGSVECWGNDYNGELARGTSGARDGVYPTPTRVPALTGAIGLAGGFDHACAVVGGELSCWGNNDDGETGSTPTPGIPVTTPKRIGALSGIVEAHAGTYFTCARDARALSCWGANDVGQLGDGSKARRSTPSPVMSAQAFVSFAVGARHVCAIDVEGALWCWGDNGNAQLGPILPTDAPTTVPTKTTIAGVDLVAAGDAHTCARAKVDGSISCWGRNDSGQLGAAPASGPSAAPQPVTLPSHAGAIVQIVAGLGHTCALDDQGHVFCWGAEDCGQCGNGITGNCNACAQGMNSDGKCTSAKTSPPQEVNGLNEIARLAAGEYHTCAFTVAKRVVCWGSNSYGQIGNGEGMGLVSSPSAP